MADVASPALNGNAGTAKALNPLSAFAAVNLDELKRPTAYSLPFAERGAEYEEELNGQKVKRYAEDQVRMVKLDSRIPNIVFCEFLRTLQPRFTSEPTKVPDLMAEAVLLKWQLVEPEMTLERLQYGLDSPVIWKLFADFFGDLLQQWRR